MPPRFRSELLLYSNNYVVDFTDVMPIQQQEWNVSPVARKNVETFNSKPRQPRYKSQFLLSLQTTVGLRTQFSERRAPTKYIKTKTQLFRCADLEINKPPNTVVVRHRSVADIN